MLENRAKSLSCSKIEQIVDCALMEGTISAKTMIPAGRVTQLAPTLVARLAGAPGGGHLAGSAAWLAAAFGAAAGAGVASERARLLRTAELLAMWGRVRRSFEASGRDCNFADTHFLGALEGVSLHLDAHGERVDGGASLNDILVCGAVWRFVILSPHEGEAIVEPPLFNAVSAAWRA